MVVLDSSFDRNSNGQIVIWYKYLSYSKNDPSAVKNKRKVNRVNQEPINEDLYKFMDEKEDEDNGEGWDVVENKRSR